MQATANLPAMALTPWQMFLSADIVVQAVMVALLLASIATWTILLVKGIEVAIATRRAAAGLRLVRSGAEPEAGDSLHVSLARLFTDAAEEEARLSIGLPPEGVKDRIALRLHRLELRLTRRMGRGTGVLASIGSCGPFVGLFGTVWGIMNSFVGIAAARTTSLAVVAPGIAEALLATAFGLVAAIPAVLIYNVLARALAGYRVALGDLSAAVLAHSARDLDRVHAGPVRAPTRLRSAAE
ncbi:MAG: tonB-system energizer ExbB [Acetobacteraceae bacterium]|nr:tonB-system energizer ExbB [Pseudomonadota bacterium]